MLSRRTWLAVSVVALVTGGGSAFGAQQSELTRVSELGNRIGQETMVRGRTGVIVEAEEQAGIRVFTLRDDYGDQVNVHTTREYPIMGATYLVTGTPRTGPSTGALYLEERSRARAYSGVPKWLLPAVGAVVVAGVLIVVLLLRRRAVVTGLPPAWGYAEIVAGPDQGKVFALRGEEVLVGRVQDPTIAIAIPLDTSVSRQHGRLLRRGEEVLFEDTGSSNGSWVNEQPAPPNRPMVLSPGALVRLGPATVLRVGEAGSAADTQRAGTEGGGSWGEAPTERAPLT